MLYIGGEKRFIFSDFYLDTRIKTDDHYNEYSLHISIGIL